MSIRPLGDRIFVRAIELPTVHDNHTEAKQLPSGLLVVESKENEAPPVEGIVEAVGTGREGIGRRRIPSAFSVGQRIMYRKGFGTHVKVLGQEYVVLAEHDILGILS